MVFGWSHHLCNVHTSWWATMIQQCVSCHRFTSLKHLPECPVSDCVFNAFRIWKVGGRTPANKLAFDENTDFVEELCGIILRPRRRGSETVDLIRSDSTCQAASYVPSSLISRRWLSDRYRRLKTCSHGCDVNLWSLYHYCGVHIVGLLLPAVRTGVQVPRWYLCAPWRHSPQHLNIWFSKHRDVEMYYVSSSAVCMWSTTRTYLKALTTRGARSTHFPQPILRILHRDCWKLFGTLNLSFYR
jgi:hypothetical protein